MFKIGAGIGCASTSFVFAISPVVAQNPVAGVTATAPNRTWLASDQIWIQALANGAVLLTCTLIIVLGLGVFHFRQQTSGDRWGPNSIQTLGTIFFFPTLIILGIYLELPRDAVTTILGAFLGYLFGRSSVNSSADRAGESGTTAVPTSGTGSGGGSLSRPLSEAEKRNSEVEPDARIQGRENPDANRERIAA